MKKNIKVLSAAGLAAVFSASAIVPAQAAVISHVIEDVDGTVYQYNKDALNASFVAYKVNPELGEAALYIDYLNTVKSKPGSRIALEDDKNGYISYKSVNEAFVASKLDPDVQFNLDSFTESAEAEQTTIESVVKVSINEDGELVKEELNQAAVALVAAKAAVEALPTLADVTIDNKADVAAAAVLVADAKALGADVTTLEATVEGLQTKIAELEEALKAVSVESVSAINAKTVEVTFDKAIDTTKAAIVITKGNIAVNVDSIKFAEDKKSAVINTTTQLTKGEYTVTVTGLTEEALTGSVTVENVKVAKINVLATTAPLNPSSASIGVGPINYLANQSAFVSYEVLNQYGEKMTGQAITWTQSTGGVVEDNTTTNVLTIGNTAAAGVNFIPGNKVYLTGVHAGTATVVNAEVTIGLEAKAAVAEIAGVYNTATKKIEDLPAGFTTGKYQLLFAVKDQYGNVLSAPTLSELTFLSDNPLFVAAPLVAGATTQTIDNVTYQAVALVPGGNATKGGTANIQIISNNTGNVAKYNITADALPAVTTFQISAPTELISGGQKVEVPFTAVDQYGNAVTKASALTGINLVATDAGTFAFETQKDGTAKLFYTAASNITAYDAVVSLTSTLSANGNYSNVQVTVKSDAKPTTVVGLNEKVSNQVAKGNTVEIKAEDLLVHDQYGRTLTKAEINTWLTATDVPGGDNALVITSDIVNTSAFEVTKNAVGTDAAAQFLTVPTDVLKVTASTASTVTADNEKLVFSLSTAATPSSTTVIPASSKTVTFTSVAQSEYASYEVADFGPMYNNKTAGTPTHANYDLTPKVYGVTASGAKVLLPASQYTLTLDTAKLTVAAGNKITDHATVGFASTDFVDTVTGQPKDKTVKVSILVKDSTGAAAATFEKDLIVTPVTPAVSTITVDKDEVTNGSAFVVHAANAITNANLNGFITKVEDQYGTVITETPTITISNVTKVDGSLFSVAANASATTNITGAEAGDKFTATFKYVGGKTEVVNFVVATP